MDAYGVFASLEWMHAGHRGGTRDFGEISEHHQIRQGLLHRYAAGDDDSDAPGTDVARQELVKISSASREDLVITLVRVSHFSRNSHHHTSVSIAISINSGV